MSEMKAYLEKLSEAVGNDGAITHEIIGLGDLLTRVSIHYSRYPDIEGDTITFLPLESAQTVERVA